MSLLFMVLGVVAGISVALVLSVYFTIHFLEWFFDRMTK